MSVPLICIVGPTAVGKTAAAVDLALKLNAQIISCDSMLVYKEPRIITAAPPPEALQAVPHHLIGIISVTQDYNVFTYYQQAGAKIIEINPEESSVSDLAGIKIRSTSAATLPSILTAMRETAPEIFKDKPNG